MNTKALLVLAAAAAAVVGWRKAQAERAEQDLWAEATDTVPPARDLR